MKSSTTPLAPKRIKDLVRLGREGMLEELSPSFDIVPVYFTQKEAQYLAYIFLCRYSGTINGKAFSFRKCYARGCPHNLCPHVAQAVMIANRYLQRDYDTLKNAGIQLSPRLFQLDDMIIKYDDIEKEKQALVSSGEVVTLHEYIGGLSSGDHAEIMIDLEILPAVEHFANYENEQTFLTAGFTAVEPDKKLTFQQCFACYETQKAESEKPAAVTLANERLEYLFKEFDAVPVKYGKKYFH